VYFSFILDKKGNKNPYFLTLNFITFLCKKQGFFADIQYKKEIRKIRSKNIRITKRCCLILDCPSLCGQHKKAAVNSYGSFFDFD